MRIVCTGIKGGSPEVLVTPGLGGWVSLGPYFFFRTSKKYYILGCIYRLLAQFGHKNWTNQCLVPCGIVPILKVLYWNRENYGYKELQTLISMSLVLFFQFHRLHPDCTASLVPNSAIIMVGGGNKKH